MGEAVEPGAVPDVPEGVVAYVDGYGNLKTTWRAGSHPAAGGGRVRLRVGGKERQAVAGEGTFAVAPGEVAFAPGSGGWRGKGGEGEVRWMEVFLRGGNAWEAFGRPGTGERVEVEAVG